MTVSQDQSRLNTMVSLSLVQAVSLLFTYLRWSFLSVRNKISNLLCCDEYLFVIKAKYIAPENRPKIRRCVVKATVPIFVPKDNDQAKEVATHVVLDLFAVAISKGEFAGLTFEKVA